VKRAIPIENVYYLFCYAWDRFPEGKAIGLGRTESPEIWDLFATVLVRGVNRLLRRGLDRGYTEIEEEISCIRGRIVVGDTLRRNLLMLGRAKCCFDDLRHDILNNRIIKASIHRLSDADELDEALRHELSRLKRSFSEVADVSLSNTLFRCIQLSRNNGSYDLLIKICELMHFALMPHPKGRGGKFLNILEDEKIMPSVFEAFVRNFFKTQQSEFAVGSELIQWDAQVLNPGGAPYLPAMRTDVTLRSKHRTIIIDTKYYSEALAKNFGQRKIRSDHLYQLFAYLTNCKSRSDGQSPPEGILLYPTAAQSVELSYVIGGHTLKIRTLLLNQPWQKIHAELLNLLIVSETSPSQ
jgi:5-methylcytosine-specific restriction enzyme subunit McrC